MSNTDAVERFNPITGYDAGHRLVGCMEQCPDGMYVSVRCYYELREESNRMREALERIARWHGEFPDTGRKWDDGSPMSYKAAYGSDGEREFMRVVAREALRAKR